MSEISYCFYLIFKKPSGYRSGGAPRVTLKSPALKSDEIAMRLEARLPDALFKRPQLSADIRIPDDMKIENNIDVETINNIEEAIKTSSGIDVSLTVVEQEET